MFKHVWSVLTIPYIRPPERKVFIDNFLVRIHFIIEMIRLTGLAPWDFEFPLPGSLTSTFLTVARSHVNPNESSNSCVSCSRFITSFLHLTWTGLGAHANVAAADKQGGIVS